MIQSEQILKIANHEKTTFQSLNLGTADLGEADQLMKNLMLKRAQDEISDLLLFLSHKPVLAYGSRKLNPADFLKPIAFFENQNIPLLQTQRGGGLTFHWPGQLNVYPILKLRKNERNLSNYMFRLEEVAIRTLADLGVQANRKREKVAQIGLWVGNRKIASMGTYFSDWVTSYGFALNLGGDYSPANFIKPCGLAVKLCTVEEIVGFVPNKNFVMKLVLEHFSEIFQREMSVSLTREAQRKKCNHSASKCPRLNGQKKEWLTSYRIKENFNNKFLAPLRLQKKYREKS